MATANESPLQTAQGALGGLLDESQTLLSFRQLYGSPTTSAAKGQAIQRMYQRLVRHYERPVNELHMRTYPEALLDLPDELLPLAFERVVKVARFFPSVEEIRGAVALDNARQIEELWQPQWQDLLRYLKRNLGNPDASMPPLDCQPALVDAVSAIGGHNFTLGAKWISQHHPFMYGIENWTLAESPRLAGERIEKRVRDLWESYR
jgi:hypothetical protein